MTSVNPMVRGAAAVALVLSFGMSSVAMADCPAADQTSTGMRVHYPTLLTCVDAEAAAYGVSQSYHYQKACSDTFGTPIGVYPYNDWHTVENVDCLLTLNAGPGWANSPGTVVDVTVCCFDGPTLDGLLTDMINSLQGPCSINGGNGLLAKLNNAVSNSVDSETLHNAGSITLAIHLADLNDALTNLATFDNQLAAKIANGQMGQPCGGDLQADSAAATAMIQAMIAAH